MPAQTVNTNTLPAGPDRDQKMAALVQSGTAALNDGDLDAALEKFEEVISCFPDRPEGHNNLGAIYASLGKPAQAEACFDRVLSLMPNNPDIHYNRGLMRARQEKFHAATLDFEVVLQNNPLDPDAHNNLGVAAFLAGDVHRARIHFQTALDSHPDHLGVFLNLCDLDEATGKSEDAIIRCRQRLATENIYAIRRRLLGLLLNRGTGDLAMAAEEAHALHALKPEDQEVQTEIDRLEKALPLLLEE